MFRFIKPNKDFLTQNHNITIDLIYCIGIRLRKIHFLKLEIKTQRAALRILVSCAPCWWNRCLTGLDVITASWILASFLSLVTWIRCFLFYAAMTMLKQVIFQTSGTQSLLPLSLSFSINPFQFKKYSYYSKREIKCCWPQTTQVSAKSCCRNNAEGCG